MHMISDELFNSIQACKKCSTISEHRKFPYTSHGNSTSKYLLVSEAPGLESLNKEKYWTGQGGTIFRSCAANASISLEKVFYLTDIVKCWPGPGNNKTNRTPNAKEIFNCSGFLEKEVEELNPELILSFGKRSSELLLDREVKINDEHGKIYSYKNGLSKILVLLHPTNINYWMNVDDYKKQVTDVFKAIASNNLNSIPGIFSQKRNIWTQKKNGVKKF